jgi:hypothetical protein
MSKQYPGGLITKTPVTPTSLSASGVWSLSDQAKAQASNTWPFPRDPQFNYVTMLLHGDGSAGSVAATGVGAGVSTTVTNFNADASTNNFNVTINGDARSDNFTPYQGNGYYSNNFGSANFFSSSSNAAFALGTGDFTVEAWVFPTSYGTLSYVLGVAVTDGLVFYVNSGNLVVRAYNTGDLLSSSTIPALNTWTHVAATRTGTTLRIFVNGVQTASTTNSTNFAQGAIYAGNDSTNAAPWFGYISNLRLVKGTALYTSAFTPSTTPLTAVSGTSWLVCQSNRFIDNSSNSFTITTSGSPQVSPAQPFTLPTTVATYGSGYFDGTGDYLSTTLTGQTFGTGNFTAEGWFYQTANVSYNTLMAQRTTGNSATGWIVGADSGGGVYAYSNGFLIGPTGTAIKNQWNHIAFVRSSGTMTLYLNGVSLGTSATSKTFSDTFAGVGGDGNDAYVLNGYASNVRYVIGTAIYTTTFTPPTSPLTAVSGTSLLTTQYNGGGNNSGFKDSSQFNFPITRNGNTTQGTFTPYGNNWSNYLDGSSFLTFPYTTNFEWSGSDFTIEAWVFPTSLTNWSYNNAGYLHSTMIGNHSATTTSDCWSFGPVSDGRVGFYYYSGGQQAVYSTATVTANQWSHVAMTKTSSGITIFVNGVGNTVTAVTGTPATDNYGMVIGKSNGTALNGYVSNTRIVKGTAVYSGTSYTVPTTPLTAITNTQFLSCQSNRFVDNSSNAAVITANGTPTVQRFSPFAPLTVYNPATYGGSGYFDGSGDYLTTADNSAFDFGSGNFTVECWIYPTVTGSNGGIVNKRAANSSYPPFLLQFNTSTVLFGVSTSGSSWAVFTASAAVSLNAWHHIALVRNGTAVTGYVDGAVSITGTATGAVTTNSSGIAIGQDQSNSGGNAFTGNIADMRLTKGTALYTAAFTPPTAPLTAITNTSFLLNYTNPAILDNSMLNDLETVGNAAVSTSVVKYGTASMYFDGTGDYLTAPASPTFLFSGNFTIECWFYKNGTGTFGGLFGNYTTNAASNWTVQLGSSNVITWYYDSASSSISSSTAFSVTTWNHVACVRSGSTLTLYLNGVSVGTATSSAVLGSASKPFLVGIANGDAINGYIDDLRVTNGYARYTTTFTPPTAAFPNG